jgi:LysM repeat protein
MKGFRQLLFAAFIGGSLLIATLLTIINLEVNQRRMETLSNQGGASAPDLVQESPVPSSTFPPSTPIPTVTPRPTVTLRPPPTFEPPTLTPDPSNTPTQTPPPTQALQFDNPGIIGLETNTPTPEITCAPRDDWTLTYTVQPNDALATIAEQYNTSVQALAEGNCLQDVNLIVNGQVLRVPGDAPPDPNRVECVPWENRTPINYATGVDGNGTITFNWVGPQARRNLLRVYAPDETMVYELTVDLRQNIQVNAAADLPQEAGLYSWQIYPLDINFVQIACPESPLWYFDKTPGASTTDTNPDPQNPLIPPVLTELFGGDEAGPGGP